MYVVPNQIFQILIETLGRNATQLPNHIIFYIVSGSYVLNLAVDWGDK